MVTIDQKLGLAVYRLGAGHNPARFIRFIETSIEMLIHEGVAGFVIDLSGVPTLSAKGISILIKLGGSLPGGSIILAGIPERIMFLLKTSGLARMFTICDDVPSAIKAYVSSENKVEDEESKASFGLRDLTKSRKPAEA